MNNDLDKLELLKNLNSNYSLEILDSVDSTMDYIKKYAITKNFGHIVVTREQTKGRGKNGKHFSSNKDKGLYFSLLLKPQGSFESIFKITIMMSVAIYSALKKLYNIDVKLKWVNDIILNDFKIGGILCEGALDINNKNLEHLVVGVGINIHNQQFPKELLNVANSIENLVDKKIDKNELLLEIINYFDIYYLEKEEYMCYYRKENYTIGKNIIVCENNKQYNAKAKDISEQGYLIVDIEDGEKILQSSVTTIIKNY